ncbi:hypothetical protein I6F26_29875 [Ensifer sp. IC3342]|nr:hypothetical protein [Ensifer sp. BRP08]MCA1450738.1 hypothetical protein [Ensifer sp. IC3342]
MILLVYDRECPACDAYCRWVRVRPSEWGLRLITPSPWRSTNREQGISKAGNPRPRATMVEFAWPSRHHQQNSKLTRWFKERIASNGVNHRPTMVNPRQFPARFSVKLSAKGAESALLYP